MKRPWILEIHTKSRHAPPGWKYYGDYSTPERAEEIAKGLISQAVRMYHRDNMKRIR